MIPLTGPPRIAGIDRRYPSLSAWMRCDWTDEESILHEYDDGHTEIYQARWRLVGECTWEAATEQEALALVSDLRGTFLVAPRTRLPGDVDWSDEVEVLCRRTTPLPATRPVYFKDGQGRPLWRVELAFESVAVFADVPGAVDGGFTVEGSDPEFRTLGTYGDATITPGPSQTVTVVDPATGDDLVLTLESALLGTPAVVAARVTETPDATIIHTREV